MPVWLQAGLWGLLSGSALLVGAGVGYLAQVAQRIIAGIMAFGAGVLLSALAFELMAEAHERGGLAATGGGFLAGALVYTLANRWLTSRGAKHRKRSGKQQPSEQQHAGSGMALALGALLDGIPESMVIGISLLAGGAVSLVAVAAVFLSNVPEGLSSAAGMRQAGRSARYVFGLWTGIAVVSGVAATVGYVALRGVGGGTIAAITALAAGAILAMLADTMIPEAFEGTHDYAGLITALGFLIAFGLSRMGG